MNEPRFSPSPSRRAPSKLVKALVLLGGFALSIGLAFKMNGGGLWEGLTPANAANGPIAAGGTSAPYDLTQLKVVTEVLKTIRDRYVDPKRVRSREMLLSALNYVQRDVAQVIVLYEEGAPTVTSQGPRWRPLLVPPKLTGSKGYRPWRGRGAEPLVGSGAKPRRLHPRGRP